MHAASCSPDNAWQHPGRVLLSTAVFACPGQAQGAPLLMLGGAVCVQGDEAFQCEVCQDRTPATKRLRLHRLPRVLLLHIKRFKYNGTTREKLTTNVTYPLKVRALLPGGCLCPASIASLPALQRRRRRGVMQKAAPLHWDRHPAEQGRLQRRSTNGAC
jgi:hypothetical protein